jgi:ribosomal protein S18 acetylase RimI-like enzyme
VGIDRIPDGIEIRPLLVLEADDIRRLNVGYSSPAYYRVEKNETPERTVISLELAPLDPPLTKHWDTDDDELAILQRAVLDGFSWAAYAGDEMVGIAITEQRRWNQSLWVWDFHVAETWRGRGIGSQLMSAVIQTARQQELRVIALETQSTNVPAIRFYRKFGFEIEGLDLSFYTNEDLQKGEVALFMKKRL